jgi:predicted GTPase
MQVFFYGDDDGKMNYNGFLSELPAASWKKVEDTKYWMAFASTKGQPVVIYANKWFDDDKQEGELDKAQAALDTYLQGKDIQPTIVVHRGHSYWVKYTIDQIQPSAKIVLLGSCGGYNVIHSVLQHAPDAHIIASKQTGKKDINQPFMNILNEKLRIGSNIDWIPLWKEFKAKAGNVEGFDDYVPPYKNLGALFIKAYNSSMGTND